MGYAAFSRAIARSIHLMAPTDDGGFVLSINGPWGSGKTSAVKMVEEALTELQEDKPVEDRIPVVHFNPWWFPSQEDLVKAFFDDVAATSDEKGVQSSIGERLRSVGRWAGKTGGLINAGLEVAPAGRFLKALAGVGYDVLDQASTKKLSLRGERDSLVNELRKAGRRILVVIDDVDRLPADEARQIFRLVKSVGDLPNITYLLLFDRTIVHKMLSSDANLHGPEWLDKIVQTSCDLPPTPHRVWRSLLTSEIERSCGTSLADSARWVDTLKLLVLPSVHTLRHLKQLNNAIQIP